MKLYEIREPPARFTRSEAHLAAAVPNPPRPSTAAFNTPASRTPFSAVQWSAESRET